MQTIKLTYGKFELARAESWQKLTCQPHALNAVRQTQSQEVKLMVLKWAIAECCSTEHRDLAVPHINTTCAHYIYKYFYLLNSTA